MYSRRMWAVWAPTAFLRPISRTRSVTAMIMVLTTDRPPMTSASSAAPVVIAVKTAPLALKALTRSLGLVALTPGTWSLIRLASASSRLREVPGLA